MPLHLGTITNHTNCDTNRLRCMMLDYVKMNDYSDRGDRGGRR